MEQYIYKFIYLFWRYYSLFGLRCFLSVCPFLSFYLEQLEGEEAQRMAKRRLERERGRREATADMSEDLSEGEKGDTLGEIAHGDSTKGRLPRISSVDVMENLVNQLKDQKLYIVLIRHELYFVQP